MVAEAGSAALAEPRWHSNAAVAATLRNAAQFAQRRGQRSQFTQRRGKRNQSAPRLPKGCPCQLPHVQLPHFLVAKR